MLRKPRPATSSVVPTPDLPDCESFDAIQALRREGFGWLSPKGGLLACDLHRHLEALAAAGVLTNEIKDVLEREADARRVRDECREKSDQGEHGDWHDYDVAKSDADRARLEVIERLYGAGWTRLGIMQSGAALCAEAHEAVLRRQGRRLSGMAELLGVDLQTYARPKEMDGYFPDRDSDEISKAHACQEIARRVLDMGAGPRVTLLATIDFGRITNSRGGYPVEIAPGRDPVALGQVILAADTPMTPAIAALHGQETDLRFEGRHICGEAQGYSTEFYDDDRLAHSVFQAESDHKARFTFALVSIKPGTTRKAALAALASAPEADKVYSRTMARLEAVLVEPPTPEQAAWLAAAGIEKLRTLDELAKEAASRMTSLREELASRPAPVKQAVHEQRATTPIERRYGNLGRFREIKNGVRGDLVVKGETVGFIAFGRPAETLKTLREGARIKVAGRINPRFDNRFQIISAERAEPLRGRRADVRSA